VIALLLTLALALQGIPVQAQQAGTISGVLKDTQGKPVAGIRMAAIARPQTLDEAVTSAAMSSLAETDEQGRYTLESIPPGRYYIAAGRLDAQTYYPGTFDLATAKEVAITPGSIVSAIDFALGDSSFGRASTGSGAATFSLSLPLRVTMEGGGTMPVSAGGRFISVKLDMGSSLITTPITSTFVNIPGPQTTAYRVTVENLPETYVVKTITYGTTDLLTNTLRLTPANFPGSMAVMAPSVNIAPSANAAVPINTGAIPATAQPNSTLLPLPQNETELLSYLTGLAAARGLQPPPGPIRPNSPVVPLGPVPQDPVALQAYKEGIEAAAAAQSRLQALFAAQLSATGTNPLIMVSVARPSQTAASLLSITLAPVPPKPTSGARVSGRMSVRGNRTVYISGIPGTVYSDGTFEVYGVPPGRHSIVTRDNPTGSSPLGASIVVEAGNLEGIELGETAMLPIRAWDPSPPRPAGNRPAGKVPLARLTGILIEELSKKPIAEGTVHVKTNGYASKSFPIDAEGRFELPPLLPGTYDLEVEIFGHSKAQQTIEIDDKDIKVEVFSRKLY
jgi:hypothetical protein